MLPPQKSARVCRLLPTLLIVFILLAACVAPPSTPEAGGTVPGGTVPPADVQTQKPFFDASPFCYDVAGDLAHAQQVVDLLAEAHRQQSTYLRSYLLFGESESVQKLLDSLGDGLVSNNLESRDITFDFEAPVGDEQAASFAGQRLAVIYRPDGEQLSADQRGFLRQGLRTGDPNVVAVPNLTIEGLTHHSIGGSPFSNPPGPSSLAEVDYEAQYAFESMQLSDASGLSSGGEGTTIYILDSWPDADTSGAASPLADQFRDNSFDDGLDLGTTSRAATVHVKTLIHEAASSTAAPDVRMHGRFVASLAHTVAPNAELRIFRVLNDAGEGHLTDLIEALAEVERQIQLAENAAGSNQPGALQARAVINLSLGVNCLEIAQDRVEQDNMGAAGVPPALGEELNNLRLLHARLLDILNAQNAVVVAAAGNNTFPNSDHYVSGLCGVTSGRSAQFPACMERVISVGASTKDLTSTDSTVACYSSGGAHIRRIFAFAGDGERAYTGGALSQCTPHHESCAMDDNQCEFGVVGLKDNGGQFGFWSGTSFAAPQVSGAAAVLLGMGLPAEQVGPCLIDAVRPDPRATSVAVLNLYKALEPSTRPASCEPTP